MVRQLGRFLLAGGAAVTIDFATFLILRWLGVPLILANTGAFTLAFITGFMINRHWTFDAAHGHGRRQLARYGAVALAGLLLNTAVLMTLVALGAAEIPAKGAATLVSATVNFALSRSWVFANDNHAAD